MRIVKVKGFGSKGQPDIQFNSDGVAYVIGTRTSPRNCPRLDGAPLGRGEIHRQHPHSSLRHIHAALSYYFDHREEAKLDVQNENQLRFVTESRDSVGASRVREKF